MAKKRRRLRKRRPYSKYKYKGPSERNYKDPRYVAFRRAVRKRDGNKCQLPGCRSRTKRIEVHHIRKYSDHIELRYEVSNGICTCHSCHQKITGHEQSYEKLLTMIVSINEKKQSK